MMKRSDFERRRRAEDAQPMGDDESHELPKGALLITLTYLLILTLLWLQVYLQLLNSGGIPRS